MKQKDVKKEYFPPKVEVVFITMENGIAAGSATLSPIDPNGGSVKEEWDSVDQSGELDW